VRERGSRRHGDTAGRGDAARCAGVAHARFGLEIARAGVMVARHFTELIAWQRCSALHKALLAMAAKPAVARDFKYCNQILEAGRSAVSNVAEGFRRYDHPEFGQFLDISLASLAEVQSLLHEARERRFVTLTEFGRLWDLSTRADKVTSALRRSVRRGAAPPLDGEPPRARRPNKPGPQP
jgi:four helix bundle protein